MNYKDLMDLGVAIAEQTAEKIMAVYQQDDFDVRVKNDTSLVTRADIIAHQLIIEKLQLANSQLPIISEESASIDWQRRRSWRTYWLIDPLDGTKEFVARNDEFSINIALIENGQPVVGVVMAPALGITYMAAKGVGAFKITGATVEAIKVRSVALRKDQKKFTTTIVVGRRSVSQSLNSFYNKMPEHDLIQLGSALKTCLVAEGKADIYPRFGDTSEWDTAAAQCILELAGGAVTDMKLSPLRYNTKDSLLNPDFIAFGDTSIDWKSYL